MNSSTMSLPVYSPELMQRWTKQGRLAGSNKLFYIVLSILTFGVFVIIVNIYELRRIQTDHRSPTVEARSDIAEAKHIVWVHARNMETGYLRHVTNVFQRVGYEIGTKESNWVVLWSHDYPFTELSSILMYMKSHQKVNHFPGSGYITNKVSLATSNIKFIPPAFKIPTDVQRFRNYIKKHSHTMWVQKSNNHRGIKIKAADELDLSSDGTFVQEYISNPLIIDKRKFDIGVYAVLTSIHPLRAYVLESDVLLRFCAEDYYPFDQTNVKKYVVGDDYTPTWEIPSLSNYFSDMKYSYKETLNVYLRNKGLNDTKLWQDIRSSIMGVYMNKEASLIQASHKYKTTRNFFELVRFDYILDDKMNIYLMEVNMSPNLSSGHFSPNKLLYEQVVYNVLNLVSIARSVPNDIFHSYHDEISMQVGDHDIQVFPETCLKCSGMCLQQECMLCHFCLSIDERLSLQNAYLEHVNRKATRRIFPPPMDQMTAKNNDQSKDLFYQRLNTKNKLIYSWFRGKCVQDVSWCS